MQNILGKIIKNKLKEVVEKKKKRNFIDAIKNSKLGDISIVPEIKLASPTEGRLGENKDIIDRAMMYEESDSDAVSVVVDNKHFGGKLEFIKQIKEVVSLPILAKDFVIDLYQIYEMRIFGADAVLLITKIVSRDKLRQFVSLCFDIGLEPVVEVQNEKELDMAMRTNTRLIAVNARDLSTFEINIDRACTLIKHIPGKFTALGLSGVSKRRDIEKYKKAGAKGVLVGTSLMRSNNVKGFLMSLRGS